MEKEVPDADTVDSGKETVNNLLKKVLPFYQPIYRVVYCVCCLITPDTQFKTLKEERITNKIRGGEGYILLTDQ